MRIGFKNVLLKLSSLSPSLCFSLSPCMTMIPVSVPPARILAMTVAIAACADLEGTSATSGDAIISSGLLETGLWTTLHTERDSADLGKALPNSSYELHVLARMRIR